jgi:hypothetical protein
MSGTVLDDWAAATYVERRSKGLTAATSTIAESEHAHRNAWKTVELLSATDQWTTSQFASDVSESAYAVSIIALGTPGSGRTYAQVDALFSTDRANYAASEQHSDPLKVLESDFIVSATGLPITLFPSVRRRFAELLAALRDEGEDRAVKRDSLRSVLRFLKQARPNLAPAFSLTESGELYLQWYKESTRAIAGITFKVGGVAVWSTSGRDAQRPMKRITAAGNSSVECLGAVLRLHAPWLFV